MKLIISGNVNKNRETSANISKTFLILFSTFYLAGNGAAEFSAVSQEVIQSPIIPPQVKPIFQEFIAKIAELKRCVDEPNLPCIKYSFINTGVKGMQKGVSLTQGPLKQLFQRMLNLDKSAVAKMNELPKSSGRQAVQIANSVFATKATWLRQYLNKPKA